MRFLSIVLLCLFTCSSTFADDLERFNTLLKKVSGNNYVNALRTTNSAEQREYVHSLNELKKTGSTITKMIIPYASRPELKHMRITQLCSQLSSIYTSVRSSPGRALEAAVDSGGGKYFLSSNVKVDMLTSDFEKERVRLGALYLLFKWSNTLKGYDYPDINIPRLPPATEYALLLNDFKMNVKLLGGRKSSPGQTTSKSKSKSKSGKKKKEEISDDIKDDIKNSFKRFTTVAGKLQKLGMRNGFSLSKYVAKVNSYIKATGSINGAFGNTLLPQEVRDEYEFAMGKLSAFAPILAEAAFGVDGDDSSSVASEETSNEMSYKDLYEVLREHRKEVIANDDGTTGISFDDETIQLYLKSLSKAEYTQYKKSARAYLAKGHDRDRAKTTAIKMLHSYILARRIKFSQAELIKIIDKINKSPERISSDENHTSISFGNSSSGAKSKLSAHDLKYDELKELRIAVMKQNYNQTGLWTDKFAVGKYEKTFSKKEKVKFQKMVSEYSEKGYESHKAKSSALNVIHSLFLGGQTNISTEELISILKKNETLLEKYSSEK